MKFIQEGQTLMAQNSYLTLGGKGLNQAVASKDCLKAMYFLSIHDDLSKFVIDGLKQEKINSDISGLQWKND